MKYRDCSIYRGEKMANGRTVINEEGEWSVIHVEGKQTAIKRERQTAIEGI